jgi:hypothetical protein
MADIEFIYTRSNGQRVLVCGRVKFLFACDCRGNGHTHAEDFYLDSVTDLDTDAKVVLEPGECVDVEDEAIELAYEDVA